tara:strand:+ start:1671 stop:2009 length:339 start_codon:yes stop_codon:yes gene_type:complete
MASNQEIVEGMMEGETYGDETNLVNQVNEAGVPLTDVQEAGPPAMVAPSLEQEDVFDAGTGRPLESGMAGLDTMGLVSMPASQILLEANSAFPSDLIMQLYEKVKDIENRGL